jgi:Raf kinase inhibitor-like YbhB/YbcL family protein
MYIACLLCPIGDVFVCLIQSVPICGEKMTKKLMIVAIWVGLVSVGCSSSDDGDYSPIDVTSNAFGYGEAIPTRHCCDGENISPAIWFTGEPEETVSFALILDDPDAPTVFTHWLIWGPMGGVGFLTIDVERIGGHSLRSGKNGFGTVGYFGPCPPKTENHRYFFRVYALDIPMDLDSGVNRSDLETAMKGHIIGYGELMGTYQGD